MLKEQMQRPGVAALPLLSHSSEHLIEKFEKQSIRDQSILHLNYDAAVRLQTKASR